MGSSIGQLLTMLVQLGAVSRDQLTLDGARADRHDDVSAQAEFRCRPRGGGTMVAGRRGDDIVTKGDPLAERLELAGEVPDLSGNPIRYEVVKVPQGGALMVVAGLMSGLLGIGSGALKVMAMDYVMHLPLKISSATSNFMIGVTAGAGALVFLARGDVSTTIAAPVAIGVTAGALAGSRVLPHLRVESLRVVFVIILLLIAAEMGWRAVSGI